MNEASKYDGLVHICYAVQPRLRGFGLGLELEYRCCITVDIGNKKKMGFVGFIEVRLMELLEFI